MLDLFTRLCTEAGCADPAATGRTMMLLLEGALVTLGMRTFTNPMEEARVAAQGILATSLKNSN